jgi:flagellar protein FlaI
MVNATLPGGSRLQATFGREVTSHGSSFSIRKFREDPFTPPELIELNTCTAEMLAYLWLVIENNRNMLFAGGTASGKTTSLNAISLFIPPTSKVISIEDTRELTLYHENWTASITRQSTSRGGEGDVDMYELLRQAMRQRPEYIIVGEVRGHEALTLFQAMSTGHTTYSTMHASDMQEVINRLENEPINVPPLMIASLNLIVIQALVHVGGERMRRMQTLTEIVGIDQDTYNFRINEVFTWNPVSDHFERGGESDILRGIMQQRGWSRMDMDAELSRRKNVLQYLVEHGIRDYKKVAKVFHLYHLNPEDVIKGIDDQTLEVDV